MYEERNEKMTEFKLVSNPRYVSLVLGDQDWCLPVLEHMASDPLLSRWFLSTLTDRDVTITLNDFNDVAERQDASFKLLSSFFAKRALVEVLSA